MMLNTYNGRIYPLEQLVAMLDVVGLKSSQLLHLHSDTSMLLAKREGPCGHQTVTPEAMLVARAHQAGFHFARVIEARDIAFEPWVRLKCQFGCPGYGTTLTCPPYSPDEIKMREILSSYSHALLVQGTPPSKQFHTRLLSLERELFLSGYAEALAFGAGPCTVCSECQPEGRCRFPDLARPSLEACGVDVYETARRAGLALQPVTHRQGYVKYVGLVLFNETRNHAHSVDPGRLDP
jgi:predicted metal-binding protein